MARAIEQRDAGSGASSGTGVVGTETVVLDRSIDAPGMEPAIEAPGAGRSMEAADPNGKTEPEPQVEVDDRL